MNLLANIIDSQTLIPDLLLAAPHVRPVLDRYGLHGCGGKLGPMDTLEFFANAHDVSLEKLLLEIRTAFEHPEATTSVSSPNMVDEESEGTERIEDTIYRPFFKAGQAVGHGPAGRSDFDARSGMGGVFVAADWVFEILHRCQYP